MGKKGVRIEKRSKIVLFSCFLQMNPNMEQQDNDLL